MSRIRWRVHCAGAVVVCLVGAHVIGLPVPLRTDGVIDVAAQAAGAEVVVRVLGVVAAVHFYATGRAVGVLIYAQVAARCAAVPGG